MLAVRHHVVVRRELVTGKIPSARDDKTGIRANRRGDDVNTVAIEEGLAVVLEVVREIDGRHPARARLTLGPVAVSERAISATGRASVSSITPLGREASTSSGRGQASVVRNGCDNAFQRAARESGAIAARRHGMVDRYAERIAFRQNRGITTAHWGVAAEARGG